ncbi:MAG: hypothetical protein M1814_003944 [Vezdaea aestivalis]|nr:MAG: hypothetical protein M1814_003944 [Vezdaea aestivalis]
MLDESLPNTLGTNDAMNQKAFLFRRSADNIVHHSTLYFSQNAETLTPTYSLRRFDPSSPASRNCYSIALLDSYSPGILYGEVLIQPEWTQPTLSAEQIRLNGGVPPPPQMITPTAFTIQLYNPDQQVLVRQVSGSWGSSYWQFELPETTFRRPSASSLDRGENDPAASALTPKIIFRWKREGKLSKDFVCAMCGKTNTVGGKKNRSAKEPDITVSLFRALRELTVYQPNLHRIDVEDLKGLELTLLLSAATIRDILFGNHRDIFNLAPESRKGSAGGRKSSSPLAGPIPIGNPFSSPPGRSALPPINTTDPRHTQMGNLPRRPAPPADVDPRTQNNGESAQGRAERRQREKQEQAEARRIKKMVEAEERESRQRQAEVDKETERLRKLYGEEERQARQAGAGVQSQQRPYGVPQSFSAPVIGRPNRPVSVPPPQSGQYWARPWGQASQAQASGPSRPYGQPQQGFLQIPAGGAPRPSSGFLNSGQTSLKPDDGRKVSKRRSFFGLGGLSSSSSSAGPDGGKLSKKKSTIF